MKKALKVILEIVAIATFFAFLVLAIMFVSSIRVPAKANSYYPETDIGFPQYWQHDARLVRNVQSTLVRYGETVDLDGVFGPSTAQGVKNLQYQYGLTVTGIVDDHFARNFGVKNWPYNRGYTLYYMADLETIYARAQYEDLIYVCTGGDGYREDNAKNTGSHLFLFRDGKLIADTPCITGNQQKRHFTPLGSHVISSRKPEATGRYSKYYDLLHLGDSIYIHSELEYFEAWRDNQVLGAHQSDGSIRVPRDFADWLYRNEPNGVTVVIDDRSFQPYGTPGYEQLLEADDYADWEEDYWDEDYYDGSVG